MTEPTPLNSLLDTIEPEAEKMIGNWELVFDRVLARLTNERPAWATPDVRVLAGKIAAKLMA